MEFYNFLGTPHLEVKNVSKQGDLLKANLLVKPHILWTKVESSKDHLSCSFP